MYTANTELQKGPSRRFLSIPLVQLLLTVSPMIQSGKRSKESKLAQTWREQF